MPQYMLLCKVNDTLTGRVNDNLYQSIAHLTIVCEKNAEIDAFGHGRKIRPTADLEINGDEMFWVWEFEDTGEPAYEIDIKRYRIS